MKGVLMLADYAEAINGKLYIQGGGWSQIRRMPKGIVNFGIAAKLFVGWNEANHKHRVVFAMQDEDGNAVRPGGEPFVIESQLEVGRPPGLRQGTDIDAAMAINVAGLPMEPGRYVLKLSVAEELVDSVTFDVN
jgi:hypothetical protein